MHGNTNKMHCAQNVSFMNVNMSAYEDTGRHKELYDYSLNLCLVDVDYRFTFFFANKLSPQKVIHDA